MQYFQLRQLLYFYFFLIKWNWLIALFATYKNLDANGQQSQIGITGVVVAFSLFFRAAIVYTIE